MHKRLFLKNADHWLSSAIVVSILCFGLLMRTADAAELKVWERPDKSYILWVKGEIAKGDYGSLLTLLQKRNAFPFIVRIQSPGGDVIEAMRIGRLARKALLDVEPEYMRCNSACALIVFSSAVNPDGDWGIGLHRPFYDKQYFAGLSFEQAQAKHKALDRSVREYLIEMNVPTAIIDKMMAVASDEIVSLNLRQYREENGIRPPAVDEWLKARCGSIPSSELNDYKDLAHLNWYELEYRPDMNRERLEDLEKEHGEGARRAKRFSLGYRDYLSSKGKKIYDCQRASIEEEQRRVLAGLKKTNSSVVGSAGVR